MQNTNEINDFKVYLILQVMCCIPAMVFCFIFIDKMLLADFAEVAHNRHDELGSCGKNSSFSIRMNNNCHSIGPNLWFQKHPKRLKRRLNFSAPNVPLGRACVKQK